MLLGCFKLVWRVSLAVNVLGYATPSSIAAILSIFLIFNINSSNCYYGWHFNATLSKLIEYGSFYKRYIMTKIYDPKLMTLK